MGKPRGLDHQGVLFALVEGDMTKKVRKPIRQLMREAAEEGAEGLRKELKARGKASQFRVTATRTGIKIRKVQ